MTQEQLAAMVYKRLKSRKMNQADLCRELEMSAPYLSLFLAGLKPPPAKVLAWLGCGQKTVYYKLKRDET